MSKISTKNILKKIFKAKPQKKVKKRVVIKKTGKTKKIIKSKAKKTKKKSQPPLHWSTCPKENIKVL